MDETLGKDILKTLKDFSLFIKEKIDEAILDQRIEKQTISNEVFKWSLNDFDYSLEKGVVSKSATGISRNIDQQVFNHKIDEEIRSTNEYEILVNDLSKKVNPTYLEGKIIMFIRRVCETYLRKNIIPEKILETFSKELLEEPIRLKAYVEVTGLTLEPTEVRINSEVKIRRTTKEDLEKDQLMDSIYGRDVFFIHPSAIIEIEIFGKSSIELQNYIEKTITLLRLFGAGGIKYLRYSMSSEAIALPVGGVTKPGDRSKSSNSYVLYKKDINRIRTFWKEMNKIVNLGFNQDQFSGFQPNIFFSYQRYSEAVLNGGIVEKKIVNAISGLESLYLNSPQELSRYLRLNVSKIMGILGYDPYKVREEIKDSYNIRSVFIHGDLLSYKAKKKLINKYGSIENLFLNIIDYLRVSILLLLCMKKDKDEFIDLIEDTFIDKDKEILFSQQIINIKERFGIF